MERTKLQAMMNIRDVIQAIRNSDLKSSARLDSLGISFNLVFTPLPASAAAASPGLDALKSQ